MCDAALMQYRAIIYLKSNLQNAEASRSPRESLTIEQVGAIKIERERPPSRDSEMIRGSLLLSEMKLEIVCAIISLAERFRW